MFRLYVEYAREPIPPLHIVVRGSAPVSAATPSFVTSHIASAEATDESVRPSARIEPLAHQSLSLVETAITPLRASQPGRRRAMVPATLTSLNSVVAVEASGTSQPTEGVATAPVDASRAVLERAEALPDIPIRIATRPVYGRREQRPPGLAALPAFRTESQVRQPADAFHHRFNTERTPRDNRSAIDRGLEYLARTQCDDGCWRFNDPHRTADAFPQPSSLRAESAATGLALLAFLGAGHDHFDGRYRRVIQDGLGFLVRIQQHRGEFFDDDDAAGKITRFYSHGIATLALCEAYGMTGDQRLRTPAQRALDHLAGKLESETLARRDLPSASDDASIIGWQLATLRSGQLAGLKVGPETLARIGDNLSASHDHAAESGSQSDTISTAVGMAVELHLGGARSAERLRLAAEELLAHPPAFDDQPAEDEANAADNPRRDTYYWYYGSQAMYYLGGDDWQAWSEQLYPRLIQSQVASGPIAGSWEPANIATSQRSDTSTRHYVTAMNLLSLETEQRRPTRVGAAQVPNSTGE
jgi:hypothetical protein